jgi:uncharacterized protein YabE (DUF348 family)
MYFFVCLFIILGAKGVYGDSLVAAVETPVIIKYDGEQLEFISTQNTIEGAIRQSGINFGGNDITDPPLDTIINGREIEVRVIRELPVLISDNNQEHLAFSAYSDPYDILDQLEIEYYPEDKIYSELILDPVEYYSVGQRVVIKRAPVYKINVDDSQITARSWAETVDRLIKEENIQLGQNDIVEPTLESSLLNRSEIVITRINFADIEEIVTIPFETIYKMDPSLGLNGKRVAVEGKDGSKTNIYHIVYKNGVEVSRTLTGTTVSGYPEDKIVYRGAQIGRANWGHYGTMQTAFKGTKGQKLLVTNLDNGRQIIVTVVDYGPVNALLDLSPDAFEALGVSLDQGHTDNVAVQLTE